VHDFDIRGFSIFGTLRGNTDRYTFKNAIKVVDLGLRLAVAQDAGCTAVPTEQAVLAGSRTGTTAMATIAPKGLSSFGRCER
jgi:hypothetical protein